MGIRACDHTSFVVSDLERATAFWVDTLGLEVDWRLEDDGPELRECVGFADARIRMVHLRIPGSAHKVELFEYMTPKGTGPTTARNHIGASHVCLIVDDIQAEYERLSRAGAHFVSAPVRFNDGPDEGSWGVYLTDPDGITIELFQPPDLEGNA